MELKRIRYKKEYEKIIADKIIEWLWDNIFSECLEILKKQTVYNDDSIIRQALQDGLIYYQDNAFYSRSGRFSSRISQELQRIGAKYSKYRNAFLIDKVKLPTEILWAIDTLSAQTSVKVLLIQSFLTKQLAELTKKEKRIVFTSAVETIMQDLQERVYKNAQDRKIELITPKISDFRANEIAKNYTNNLDFWIKNWLESEDFNNVTIPKMRETVGQMAIEGKSTKDIENYLLQSFTKSKKHAKFLARNETAIATSSYLSAKYQEEGFESFKWITNLDGRERPEHRQLNGQVFQFNDPPVIDLRTGQKGLPGQTYNCLTGDMQITSPFLHNRIFKRKFRGEAVTLITSVGAIKLTPNHPVLTDKGWVKASALNIGDRIAKISDETFLASGSYPNNTKTTIEEFYSFYSVLFNEKRVALTDKDFHGDVSVDKQVNTINIKTKLGNYTKTYISQSRIEQVLTEANELFGSVDASSNRAFLQAFPFSRFVTDSFVGSLDKAFTFFFGSESHTVEHTLRAVSWLNSLLFEVTGYDITRNSVFLSELLNAPAGSIKFYQLILWELAYTVINWRITEFSHSFGDCFTFNAEQLGQLGNSLPAPIEFDTITDKIISVFDGHIYNLENSNNWYLTQYYITKNCRCGFVPVIDKLFFENRQKLFKAQNSLKGKIIKCLKAITKPKKYQPI